MKLSQIRRGLFLVAIAGTCLFSSISNAANIIVGTGNDTSYLVLQSTNLGVRTYVVRYTFSSGPYNARFLFDQAIAGDASLSASFGQFGTFGNPPVPNYYVISINGESSATDYWAQWVSGGLGYQNPDYSFNSGAPALGEWTEGYGISTHTIAPGSWDALFFSDGVSKPSVAPVPETSSAILAILGSLVIFKRRRIS